MVQYQVRIQVDPSGAVQLFLVGRKCLLIGRGASQVQREGGGEGLGDVREDVEQKNDARVGVVDDESAVDDVDGDLGERDGD